MRNKRDLRGFTLVELLVVIGVIGVLISILLPALSRARGQANLIDCQSNLHQQGTLMQTYITENRGYFPYGRGQMHWGGVGVYSYGDYNTPTWYWMDSLALLIKPVRKGKPTDYNYLDEQNEAIDYPGIFHDVDTVQLPYAPSVFPPVSGQAVYQQCCDYTANIRVLPDCDTQDFAQGAATANLIGSGSLKRVPGLLPLRQSGSIRRSSEVMMLWCGPADLFTLPGYSYGAQPLSWQLDNSAIINGSCLLYPQPGQTTYKPAFYENKIALGVSTDWSGGPAVTTNDLKSQNIDIFSSQYSLYNMRFRHLGNTTCNFLFIDFHVEQRLLGDVKSKEICLNGVIPGAMPPIYP